MFDTGGDTLLLNLGNSQARQFVTDFISKKIDEFGLGCYRRDFNMDPLGYWQAADAPDRQGMAEIRHIEGLYASHARDVWMVYQLDRPNSGKGLVVAQGVSASSANMFSRASTILTVARTSTLLVPSQVS